MARTFGVAPHQFVRIQLGRAARQNMRGQPTVGGRHIGFHSLRLMGGQAVQHQGQRLLAPVHQLLEQVHERLAIERAVVCRKPERTLGTDRRGRADALALSEHIHHQVPRSCAATVRAKARFVPKFDHRTVAFGLSGQGVTGLALQGLLRRQTQVRQQRADRGETQADSEFYGHQFAHDLSCP